MAGALDSIRVVEMALQYPGPYCSMLLAGLGADIIKVERPDIGDAARRRPAFFDVINRGKKSITLDLKSTAGRAILYRLIETCDVVTEGFRPGVAARLGIDYPTLSALNPRLIYCSITGYGQSGPYRGLPGHDLNYMAMSGMLQQFLDSTGKPVLPGVAIADLSAGMFAVIGILAGLAARKRTGQGQHVDVAMLDGLLSWMGTNLSLYAAHGETQRQRDAGYGLFNTADGKLLALGIAHENWFWDRLCATLGLGEMIGIPAAERARRRPELIKPLQEALLKKTRAEWLRLLEDADVPASPVQEPSDILNDPHVKSRGMVDVIDNWRGRSVRAGLPLRFSPGAPPRQPADVPELGAHTEEILKRLGYGKEEIEQFRTKGVI